MITDYTLWNGSTVKVKIKIEGNLVTYFADREGTQVWKTLKLGKDFNGEEDTKFEGLPIAETIDELINFEAALNDREDIDGFWDRVDR